MVVLSQQKYKELLNIFGRETEVGQAPEELRNQIDLYHKVYANVPPLTSPIDKERFMLLTYLELTGMDIASDVIRQAFNGRDNVFEIYDFNFNQLYRSLSFLSFKTYPLVTLMARSNFVLYERENDYVPELQKQLKEFLTELTPRQLNIPAHKVWEALDEGNKSYHWLMKLGMVAPVRSLASGEVTCFFITHRTEQVFKSPFLRLSHAGQEP